MKYIVLATIAIVGSLFGYAQFLSERTASYEIRLDSISFHPQSAAEGGMHCGLAFSVREIKVQPIDILAEPPAFRVPETYRSCDWDQAQEASSFNGKWIRCSGPEPSGLRKKCVFVESGKYIGFTPWFLG